jgi:hypothetical protein
MQSERVSEKGEGVRNRASAREREKERKEAREGEKGVKKIDVIL